MAKIKNAAENLEISAEPRAIKIPRKTSAIAMPANKINCALSRLTLKFASNIMKIKTLSTESEYSVSHPAKNSSPWPATPLNWRFIPKTIAAIT
ncbi:unannotated protein [freshwater metagenome]